MSMTGGSSPPPSTFVFVDADDDGLPLSRRQAQQACTACRRKKKRCPHGKRIATAARARARRTGAAATATGTGTATDSTSLELIEPCTFQTEPNSPSPTWARTTEIAAAADAMASQLVALSASRFVGDLDPESILIEAAAEQTRAESNGASSLHRNHSEVGTWMQQQQQQPAEGLAGDDLGTAAAAEQPASADGIDGDGGFASASSPAPRANPEGAPVPGLRLQLPFSSTATAGPAPGEEATAVGPPDPDYFRLHAIYAEQIQPVLPFFELIDLDFISTAHRLSLRNRVFRQAVALAAAVDSSAAPHLRLQPGGPVLPFQAFHQRVAKAIFASLDANFLSDRVDRTRVLLLLSLFYQPSNPLERDMAPLLFSQAVHFAQSLGLHLRVFQGGPLSEDGTVERLFCLCWALDRINAAFHGRPCLLHERDTDRDLDECIAVQTDPAFRLFMAVAKLLDNVIGLYRPRGAEPPAPAPAPVDLPIFESMIVSVGGERLSPRILTTLEVFYHAVSVLSCRQSLRDFHPSAPPLAHLPQPHLNARRSLSADRITEIVASACLATAGHNNNNNNNGGGGGGGGGGVCILPFVPYAVALSLSVAYRKMRYSQIPMYRLRGKNRFQEIVNLLQKLGAVYTSARVNANLGVSILRELNKTVKEFAGSSMPTPGHLQTTTTTTTKIPIPISMPTPPPPPPLRVAQQPQAQAPPQDHWGDDATTDTTTITATSDSRHLLGQQQQQQEEEDEEEGEASAIRDAVQHIFGAHVSSPSPFPPVTDNEIMPPLSPPTWAQIEDIDLFMHFDPAYDLNAVEAALEANLDMGLPQTWNLPWPD